jgi:hypothetical protein
VQKRAKVPLKSELGSLPALKRYRALPVLSTFTNERLCCCLQVRAKVPLKSKLGGLSTLQAAVCYDTLGNARQAEALYKR